MKIKNPFKKKESQAEAILARLTGNKIVCPDCGRACDTVVVERFQTRTFKLNLEKKKLEMLDVAEDTEWVTNDYALHCPHCDTLNLDGDIDLDMSEVRY